MVALPSAGGMMALSFSRRIALAASCGAIIAIATCLSGPFAHVAQAGIDFSGCKDSSGRDVETLIDDRLQVVAELQRTQNDSGFVVAVNPYTSYYSPEMMLWLYHRQCALIGIMKDRAGAEAPNAICEAARAMRDRQLLGRYEMESIARTANPKEMPDFEKELGPWRRIDLMRCF
jgi:hypothetical protein